MQFTCDFDDTRNHDPVDCVHEQLWRDGSGPRSVLPTSAPYAIDVEDVIGYDPLWDAMMKCKRGVMWKGTVARFCENGAEQIQRMTDELHAGTYEHSTPSRFCVTYPKHREIVAQQFRDRVYHRSIVDNLLLPCLEPTWIYDNAACRAGKGTDFARERFKRFLQESYRKYGMSGGVLCVDVRHYFASIRHAVVEDDLDRHLPGWGVEMVMGALSAHYPGDVGFNPGSPIVQVVGINVPSRIDHFVKERLFVRGYSRYMDDLRLVHCDLDYLNGCMVDIGREFSHIGLALHPGKTKVIPMGETVRYLGFDYRVTSSGKVLMFVAPEGVKTCRRKLRRLARLEAAGEKPVGTTRTAYEGWRAHAEKGDSRKLLGRMDEFYANLMREAEASND